MVIDLHYTSHGSGEEDILLIHGWAGSRLSWQRVIQQSDLNVRWWALDLPGHGLSPAPDAPATIDYHLRAVLDFVESHPIQQPILIAHSTGGMIALKLAHQRPDLIRGLVLVSPVVTGEFTGDGSGSRFLRSERGQSFLRRTQKLWPYLQNRSVINTLLAPFEIDPQGRRSLLDDFTVMDAEGAIETLISLAHETMEPHLGEITHPALIIVGGKDMTVPPDEGKCAAERMPNARLVVFPEARHRPMDTETGRFNQFVSQFLEEHDLLDGWLRAALKN